MDRGAWWATVCGVAELDTTEVTWQHSVTKTGWHQWRDRHIRQGSRTDGPGTHKTDAPGDPRVTHWGKDRLRNRWHFR